MVERRIERLCSLLGAQSLTEEYQLAMASCAKAMVKFPVSSVVLTDYMKGKYRCLQEKILQCFRDCLELQTPVEILKDEHQELTMRQLQRLVREAGIRPLKALLDDPYQYSAITEAAGTIDLSLAIKLGVQFSLCGAVMNLGTHKHRDRYYAGIENLDYLGCFAMTELRQADDLLTYARSGECRPSGQSLELETSACKLSLRNLPSEVYSTEWDAIMIDAPRGYFPEAPGRMTAIYSAGVMARNRKKEGNTDIFVHDVDRAVEEKYSKAFLCENNLVEFEGRLWHFSVPPNEGSKEDEFCSGDRGGQRDQKYIKNASTGSA